MNIDKCYVCGKETLPGHTVHLECEAELKTPDEYLWIHQDSMYGLGNFINLTPTLRAMSDYLEQKIPVYFDLDFVRDCFKDCPFIEIIDEKPYNRALFSSGLVDHRNNVPDYVHVYRTLLQRYPMKEMGHTYVDTADEIKIDRPPYTLFMYGTGNEDPLYMARKSPPRESYEQYMGQRHDIFTGSEADYNRTDWFDGMEHMVGDIRMGLALIRDAEQVVSNDTGLAHAAGAMNKRTVILWKYSALPKNGNPGRNTVIKLV